MTAIEALNGGKMYDPKTVEWFMLLRYAQAHHIKRTGQLRPMGWESIPLNELMKKGRRDRSYAAP